MCPANPIWRETEPQVSLARYHPRPQRLPGEGTLFDGLTTNRRRYQHSSGAEEGNHLKRQPSLNLVLKGLSNDAVKLGQDLHGKLRVDALVPNKFIERIRQAGAEAMCSEQCQQGPRSTSRMQGRREVALMAA